MVNGFLISYLMLLFTWEKAELVCKSPRRLIEGIYLNKKLNLYKTMERGEFEFILH